MRRRRDSIKCYLFILLIFLFSILKYKSCDTINTSCVLLQLFLLGIICGRHRINNDHPQVAIKRFENTKTRSQQFNNNFFIVYNS